MSPKALKDAIRQKAGELGFELYVKKEKALKLFNILIDKGKN